MSATKISRTNKEVVLGFIEEVINQKRLDRFDEYFGHNSVYHTGPYVGLGFNEDCTSGEKFILNEIAPGGPADGKLLVGDVVVHVEDEQRTWNTFEELKTIEWSWGVIGTPVTLQVRRDDQILGVNLKRGLIQGWTQPIHRGWFQQLLLDDWPDLQQTVDCILEDGDRVAVYLTNVGTHALYGRQAVWSEIDFFRLRDGKIVEAWSLEDTCGQLKQLGYRMEPPAE